MNPHVPLQLDGNLVSSIRPSFPSYSVPESVVTLFRLEAYRKIYDEITREMAKARQQPEYFEEGLSLGIVSVETVFEMLAAFKAMRNSFCNSAYHTIRELRTLAEKGGATSDELRQAMNNLAKRAPRVLHTLKLNTENDGE